MRRALNNLWFAATAQPDRIDRTTDAGLGWPLAYIVAMMIGLGLSTLIRILLNRTSTNRMTLEESCFSADADALRRLRAIPQAPFFVEMGPFIGSLRGIDIPAWFRDDQGRTHEFVTSHTHPTPPTLSAAESFVAPGLVYRLVHDQTWSSGR